MIKNYFNKIKITNNNNILLVTGAAGYIGTHLLDLLHKNYSHKIRVIDNFSFLKLSYFKKKYPKIDFIKGDVTNIEDVNSALKDVHTVICLAAIVGDPACALNNIITYDINYNSVRLLVDLMNVNQVRKLIFASSCSVYGESEDQIILNEQSDLNPVSTYAMTRIISEEYIKLNLIGQYNILRLSTIFGHSKRPRLDLVVNLLTYKSAKNLPAQVFGGNQWRPFLHCMDAAKAFYFFATTDNKENGIYNIGHNSMNYKLQDIAKIINYNLNSEAVVVNNNIDDHRNYRVNFDKYNFLNYDFTPITLEQGITEMLKLYKKTKITINDTSTSNLLHYKNKFNC